jgi:hypothetical protein
MQYVDILNMIINKMLLANIMIPVTTLSDSSMLLQ